MPASTVDVGLTDALDPLVGDRLRPLLDRVDARAGVRVDDDGIHVRRLLRTVHVPWGRVDHVALDSRLDLVLTFALGLLPVTRLPVVGTAVQHTADRIATEVGMRLVPGLRHRAGWAVATVVQRSWHRDLDWERSSRVVALLYPEVTRQLVAHATERGIPVRRDRGPDTPGGAR